ncbi:MAG: hypothetical protein MJ107_00970 [Lachnospiraceae bacterium]|nr:hypothetical protein [Lachnospiraceae bacterium]
MEHPSDRERIVDATVYGMGKSAGNCTSELLALHLNQYYGKHYDICQYLEVMDNDLMPIYNKHYWGYRYNFYLSAMENCHPDYVKYLLDKRTLTVSDVSEILHRIPEERKLHYNVDIIEDLYIKHQSSFAFEGSGFNELQGILKGKNVILIGPGGSLYDNIDLVRHEQEKLDAVLISTNFAPKEFECDFVFCSNAKRYNRMVDSLSAEPFGNKLIITSNVNAFDIKPDYTINYQFLLEKENYLIDNALILCLSLLSKIGIGQVKLVGFDGLSNTEKDYFDVSYSFHFSRDDRDDINSRTKDSLAKLSKEVDIEFLTASIYQE